MPRQKRPAFQVSRHGTNALMLRFEQSVISQIPLCADANPTPLWPFPRTIDGRRLGLHGIHPMGIFPEGPSPTRSPWGRHEDRSRSTPVLPTLRNHQDPSVAIVPPPSLPVHKTRPPSSAAVPKSHQTTIRLRPPLGRRVWNSRSSPSTYCL